MTGTEHYFSYKNATLCFTKSGTGKHILMAFPGFGQSRSIYSQLSMDHGEEITLYSFDLFFHGKSEWGYKENPITKEFWKDLMETFLNEQRIERLSIIGFSLGARFVLATFETLPERINHLFLIAPDGLYSNGWYTVATSTFITRRLFKTMMDKSGIFFSLTSLLGRLNVLNPRLLRFAEHQLKSKEMRKKVYYSWVVFRRLFISQKVFQKAAMHYQNKITILLGRHDTIITTKSIEKSLGKSFPVKVIILETGHNTLISSFVEGDYLLTSLKRD
jgi:pimeloyl-ACP methyl ester carboxylesterase